MSQPTKLRSVLEEAKEHLGNAVILTDQAAADGQAEPMTGDQPARSKLNTLLGKTSTPQKTSSLFQRVGVAQRPTYDLIADRVLGPETRQHRTFLDEGSGYAEHVAERLRQLQERLKARPIDEETIAEERGYVGLEQDGRPVWMQILDEQRGRAIHALQGDLAPPDQSDPLHAAHVLDIAASWPPRLVWSNHRTFKQWFVCEENFEATQCCEVVIDHPGTRMNLLHLEAHPQSGCTLLIQSTGQALLRRQEGHVLTLSAADVASPDAMNSRWKDALAGATALLIDDVQEFAHAQEWNHQLGLLLDHALNLGLQVVVGGRGKCDSFPPSRLKELLSTAVTAELYPPSVPTLMAYGRWRCVQRNMLVSDVHLAQMARMEPASWRAMDGRLEQLALAIDRGAVLLDHDHVANVLSPSSSSPSSVAMATKRVEDVAKTLVGEALDSVYSSIDPGGVELHMPLKPMPEDEYSPPDWDEHTFDRNRPDGFEQRLAQAVERVTPAHPSVLDVHERERYLISDDALALDDIERAIDDGCNTYKALVRDTRRLPAGGATEMQLSVRLAADAKKQGGLEQ
ncbi:MAG: DnaA/Hda family protein, partial [Candidatus Poseidonia sp.]|nr:DnaA/Hda family protein [Poseidonia sp.]